MLKYIKEQIDAFRELRKKKYFGSTFTTIIIVLFCLAVFSVFSNLKDYGKKQQIAFLIYPEILSNLEGVDKKGNNFVQTDYRSFYKAFNILKIDGQLKNFYTNLERFDGNLSREDLLLIKEQGEEVKRLLNYYFGCRDFFEYTEAQSKRIRVISEDTGVAPFNPVCYWRFSSIWIRFQILYIILVAIWLIFYKKILRRLA